MPSNQSIWKAFVGATALTLVGSALFLNEFGATDENLGLLLRLTARLSFVTLLVVFVARPLRQLFQTPFTAALLRTRPLIGVTFAGIHTGHLMLLIYRAQQLPDVEFTLAGNPLGALVYLLIFAMLITTFGGPRRAIGPKAWRILHKTGLYFATFGFAQTQLPRSVDDLSEMNWWLVSLLAAALIIRLTAFLVERRKRLQHGGD